MYTLLLAVMPQLTIKTTTTKNNNSLNQQQHKHDQANITVFKAHDNQRHRSDLPTGKQFDRLINNVNTINNGSPLKKHLQYTEKKNMVFQV